jgi:hypothetical protein
MPASAGPLATALDNFSPRGQLEDGIADVPGEIDRCHRHLPFVRFREIAGHPVEVHRQLAGCFGVEQLR